MKNIMIIDDDVYIGDMLEETLHKAGYETMRAFSGTEAVYVLEKKTPDLILLDLMLPGMCGEQVLAKIQGIPVIVVSARVELEDKVKLLLGGAVDYVTKPFHVEELMARIQVHLRNPVSREKRTILTYDEIEMDVEEYLVCVNHVPVKLTKTEYAILKMLLQNSAQVITKSQILDLISIDTPDCTETSLKVHISNLRKRLWDVNGVDYIEAVWGIGFKLRERNDQG